MGFIVRSQLYADSRNRVPMKILDTLPEKIAVFERFLRASVASDNLRWSRV